MPEPIPDAITRMYPYVNPDSWIRLSEHRYRAAHPNDQYSIIAVTVFGETMSRGVEADEGKERAAFADLINHAAQLAGHRVACAEGTPVVRPDTVAHRGVVGCCWWCGAYPGQHVTREDHAESAESADDGLCGDCMDGKCHGTDPDDCGCDRHAASVEAADLDAEEDDDEHPL
jgi:hypothetical protein